MSRSKLDVAGESILKLVDLPMMVPRGKYSLDFFKDSVKLHGKTNNYKILYKDINRCFILPLPEESFKYYVLALNEPIRLGQTQHYYLVFKFGNDEFEVNLNMSEEEIKEYEGLKPTLSG